MPTRRDFARAIAASAVLATAPRAIAQGIGRPSRIIVGFSPGGSTDILARLLAQQLSAYASPLLVENKPGAGGRIALETLKSAPPDGSSMVVTPASVAVIYPHIYKSLSYDPSRDFVSATTVCATPFALTVGPMVPDTVKTLADFIGWCKANPGKASFGSSGAGSMPHFTGVMLARDAEMTFTHVAYQGAAQAIQDVLGGQIAANLSPSVNGLQHVRAGAIRALATSGPKRSAFLPDVPTLKESGFPTLEAIEWYGLFLPAKTPSDIADKLRGAVKAAVATKEFKDGMDRLSFEPDSETGADLTPRLVADLKKWGPIVKESGFTAD
jgi:tripartite-type tricarboxylate transporter receptor subunit TctC